MRDSKSEGKEMIRHVLFVSRNPRNFRYRRPVDTLFVELVLLKYGKEVSSLKLNVLSAGTKSVCFLSASTNNCQHNRLPKYITN